MNNYKHYVRLDDNNIIIHAFSDAFETPQQNDICITPEGTIERHYNLILTDFYNHFLYKYIDGEIVEINIEDYYPLAELKDDRIAYIKQSAYYELKATDWKVLRHRDQLADDSTGSSTSLSDNEYQALLLERQNIRDYSNQLETEINSASDRTGVEAVVWNYS